MNIVYKDTQDLTESMLIIPVFESEDEISFNNFTIAKTVFSGKKDSVYIKEEKNSILLFIGLGKNPNYRTTKTIFRRISAKHTSYLKEKAAIIFPEKFEDNLVEAAILGFVLGTYSIGHYKKDKKENAFATDFTLELISKSNLKSSAEKGLKIANAQLQTLALVDLPPNKVTPEYLANWAINAGKKYGFDVKVFGTEESLKVGLHAFSAVGQGSNRESQFIIMDYHPQNSKKHVGLVGKGITFDTGGLNIKTAGMVHMKCDMAGGAAVLGAMQLIADLQLPFRVTAIVPACENAVDAKSYLPSDVIQSYHGSSIEIIDTDAEGRLILADGLSYLIKNYSPETIVDVATLTGSAVATLGYECAALFTNNSDLSQKLQQSGDQIGERLWQLPLWDEYKSDIDSEIADVKNYSGKPVAGAISAAKFLEYFTDSHPSWAHIDIAGVAFGDDEFAKTKHATSFGVHLITNFIENL